MAAQCHTSTADGSEHKCHTRERFIDAKFCYTPVLCSVRGGSEQCEFKLPKSVTWSDALRMLRAIAEINLGAREKKWTRCVCTSCQFYSQRTLCDCCLAEHTLTIWRTFSEQADK